MGLSDDQKAMLRLLAQREEGYEDMAKLMGISVEEVRARVKEALAEVDEAEPAAEMPPEPPASPPPVPEPPARTEEPAAPPPPPPPPPPPAAPKAREPRRPSPRIKLPKDRGALIGLGAGALAIVALAIVLVLSGGGDGGDSSTATASGEQSSATSTAEEGNLTQAILVPTGDAEASGRALFGRYEESVLLQIEAEGLAPSPQGESYTVWLYRSPKLALQVGAVRVGEAGKIAAQFQIPAQLLDLRRQRRLRPGRRLADPDRRVQSGLQQGEKRKQGAALRRRKRSARRDHRPRSSGAAVVSQAACRGS